MAGLNAILSNHLGMADLGLCGDGLVPDEYNMGTTYVWILSSSLPQTNKQRGYWNDAELWDDTMVWYD